MGWKSAVKRLLYFLLYYSGAEFILARMIHADAAAVIMYHGVCDDSKLPEQVGFHLTPQVFERQLRILQRRYPVIAVSDLLDRLASGQKMQNCVALTFDDGYRNNLTHAAPLLSRYGFPFSVYLTTHYIEHGEWTPLNQLYALWFQGKIPESDVERIRESIRLRTRQEAGAVITDLAERTRQAGLPDDDTYTMLTWQQARELAAAGAEIGAHSHTHCSMAAESVETCREELLVSKQLIEERLGMPVSLFAYPYGRRPYIDPGRGQLVRECGYRCAITTESGTVVRGTDPFRLPRVGLPAQPHLFACELLRHFLVARRRHG